MCHKRSYSVSWTFTTCWIATVTQIQEYTFYENKIKAMFFLYIILFLYIITLKMH